MAITHYSIEGNGGCCSRVTIYALDITDGKAKRLRISEHNLRTVAEKKLAKLKAAIAAQK